MASELKIQPDLILSELEARQFLLAHHCLWPPRSMQGKTGILDVFNVLGCIQFDPVNICGRNPDLVLQSRIANYRPAMLDELLYRERVLWDGWDKLASIHLSAHWPHFRRWREGNQRNFWHSHEAPARVQPLILEAIRERGALSSLDLEKNEQIDGFWGIPVRVERAALENLFTMGEIGIHHRVGSRRYFDLTERLLPAAILSAPDPFPMDEDYLEWHVLRRLGSIGLAYLAANEAWAGIQGSSSTSRRAMVERLIRQGKVIATGVEGVEKTVYYMRAQDLPLLEKIKSDPMPEPRAALLAPLDNMLWQRQTLRKVFGFDYIWEVYKPAHTRQYGHYVLPVLYGNRFIARCEPVHDRKKNLMVLRGWWWETGVAQDKSLEKAIGDCLLEFCSYLGAERIVLEGQAADDPWLVKIAAAAG